MHNGFIFLSFVQSIILNSPFCYCIRLEIWRNGNDMLNSVHVNFGSISNIRSIGNPGKLDDQLPITSTLFIFKYTKYTIYKKTSPALLGVSVHFIYNSMLSAILWYFTRYFTRYFTKYQNTLIFYKESKYLLLSFYIYPCLSYLHRSILMYLVSVDPKHFSTSTHI